MSGVRPTDMRTALLVASIGILLAGCSSGDSGQVIHNLPGAVGTLAPPSSPAPRQSPPTVPCSEARPVVLTEAVIGICLHAGETVTLVLPHALGRWEPPSTDNDSVAEVDNVENHPDGVTTFDLVARAPGAAEVTSNNNSGPGSTRPSRPARLVVTVTAATNG
jgi:hypothetical protein